MTIFDAETGPLDREWVLSMCDPYPPFAKPAPFDPGSVKTGNLKDQAKIREKIELAEQKHKEDELNAYPLWLQAKSDYEEKQLDNAAKHAETGKLLAIGYSDMNTREVGINTGSEVELLNTLWEVAVQEMIEVDGLIIGFATHFFDFPFAIRRSIVNGVKLPMGLLDKNRFWHPHSIDLHEIWQCGRREERISLHNLDRLLGGQGKNGDGGEFHRLFHGTKDERQQALDYLKNDIAITSNVARKMGVGKSWR